MSDLLLNTTVSREPLQASFSDAANPLGLDGIEFVEYATTKPQALGQVLEMMGFRPVARHRSREVL
ncbi:MAG: 4-hydroxyphenylpyruvate dioxygenase, partial [Hydrogenophaga sp.]|nr:4-hydroxyphenylpyruvate dioxygenase [Hydrogenophaga sp.]